MRLPSPTDVEVGVAAALSSQVVVYLIIESTCVTSRRAVSWTESSYTVGVIWGRRRRRYRFRDRPCGVGRRFGLLRAERSGGDAEQYGQAAHQVVLYVVGRSPGYNVTMTVPATSRQTRTFEDRADALAHFFLRAAEAPRLIAYDDAVGCPLDQALAAIEWTSGWASWRRTT